MCYLWWCWCFCTNERSWSRVPSVGSNTWSFGRLPWPWKDRTWLLQVSLSRWSWQVIIVYYFCCQYLWCFIECWTWVSSLKFVELLKKTLCLARKNVKLWCFRQLSQKKSKCSPEISSNDTFSWLLVELDPHLRILHKKGLFHFVLWPIFRKHLHEVHFRRVEI